MFLVDTNVLLDVFANDPMQTAWRFSPETSGGSGPTSRGEWFRPRLRPELREPPVQHVSADTPPLVPARMVNEYVYCP